MLPIVFKISRMRILEKRRRLTLPSAPQKADTRGGQHCPFEQDL